MTYLELFLQSELMLKNGTYDIFGCCASSLYRRPYIKEMLKILFEVTVLRLALCKYLKIDSLVFLRKCQICNLTKVYCQGELEWNELLMRRYVGREVSFVSL